MRYWIGAFVFVWSAILLAVPPTTSAECDAVSQLVAGPEASSPPGPSVKPVWQARDIEVTPFDAAKWVEENRRADDSALKEKFWHEKDAWVQSFMEKLIASPSSGREKEEAFQRLTQTIEARRVSLEASLRALRGRRGRSFKLRPWLSTRWEPGGGVVLFYGEIGQVLEFHPNGDIYRARVGDIAKIGSLAPGWRPPYGPDGKPVPPPRGLLENSRKQLVPKEP